MTGLRRLLREHEETVEADLQRYYRVDYRDRWRGDLTLRRLLVLLRGLPPTSGTAVALHGPHWSIEAHLLDELRLSRPRYRGTPAPKPHPQRPLGKKKPAKPFDRRRISAALQRRRARLAAIEQGDIT